MRHVGPPARFARKKSRRLGNRLKLNLHRREVGGIKRSEMNDCWLVPWVPSWTLLSFPNCLALLKECTDTFVLVFSREAQRKQIHFATQALIKIGLRRKLHRFLRQLQSDGALLGDAI